MSELKVPLCDWCGELIKLQAPHHGMVGMASYVIEPAGVDRTICPECYEKCVQHIVVRIQNELGAPYDFDYASGDEELIGARMAALRMLHALWRLLPDTAIAIDREIKNACEVLSERYASLNPPSEGG